MAVGRRGNIFNKVYDQLRVYLSSEHIPLTVFVDRFRVTEELKSNFSSLEKPSANAHLIFNGNNDIEVIDGTIGVEFDYELALNTIISRFEQGNPSMIVMSAKTIYPEVMTAEVADIKDQVNQFLALPPLTLTADKKNWTITPATMKSWLELGKINSATKVRFSKTAIEDYIKKILRLNLKLKPCPLVSKLLMVGRLFGNQVKTE